MAARTEAKSKCGFALLPLTSRITCVLAAPLCRGRRNIRRTATERRGYSVRDDCKIIDVHAKYSTSHLSAHSDMHRDCKHDWHRHFHQPWISDSRFADWFRHRVSLDCWRNLRDVRRAFLRGTRRSVATLWWRIPFSARDLSPIDRLSRRLDFGHGR